MERSPIFYNRIGVFEAMGKPDNDKEQDQVYSRGPQRAAQQRSYSQKGSKPNAPTSVVSSRSHAGGKNTELALDVFRSCYRERHGRDCLPINRAHTTAMADMIRDFGLENVLELIRFYFTHGADSEWFQEKGFDIPTLKANANRLWSWASEKKKPMWIVGRTSSGEDVVSSDPDWLKGAPGYMKPIPVKS